MPKTPAARQDAFIPAQADTEAQEQLGKTLVRAMIAAAKADGKIDGDEKEAIFTKLETMSLSSEEKAWVFDDLSPLDINAVVARADTPEHASEIYAASLVAITADTASERAYLDALATKLKLEPGLVDEIHKGGGANPCCARPSRRLRLPIRPRAATSSYRGYTRARFSAGLQDRRHLSCKQEAHHGTRSLLIR